MQEVWLLANRAPGARMAIILRETGVLNKYTTPAVYVPGVQVAAILRKTDALNKAGDTNDCAATWSRWAHGDDPARDEHDERGARRRRVSKRARG